MKISLAQINTTVGAIEANTELVIEQIQAAKKEGIELVVFPELTLTGYPPQDLLEYGSFIEQNLDALERIAQETDENTGAIVGFVSRNQVLEGKGIYNSAALLGNGLILSIHNKTLLPTYDVFDEGRWFDPADEVKLAEWKGKKIGIAICEDFWNNEVVWSRAYYKENPIKQLGKLNPDFFVSISASPFTLGKRKVRHKIYSDLCKKYQVPLVQVNLVGGNDSLVFDGWSSAYNASGEVIAQAKDFEVDQIAFDLDSNSGPKNKVCETDMEKVYRTLFLGLKDYLAKCGFKKVVIGLSGGIDSALTAAIAADALGPENVVGVSMPSRYSSEHSKDDAKLLADILGIQYHTVPIESMFKAFNSELEPIFEGKDPDITEENIQSRCRGLTLMALSNKFGYLVLSTGNKSENAVGYATIYGDMCGGLALISDLPKTMVFELSRWINREKEIIPWNTINKPPSAELRPDQKDTDSLPEYEELDPIIEAYVEDFKSIEQIIADGHDEKTVKRIIRLINLNEYKRRQAAPGIKVTSKAFGFGRRMPIAAKYPSK